MQSLQYIATYCISSFIGCIQPALKGDSEALSSVTGIIDGTGSVGAALGQVHTYSVLWHIID